MAIDFSTLGVSKELVSMLKQNGITEPTPVQEQAIPALLSGKDITAQAQTGTGKTLAFVLPMMEKINTNESYVQALIMTPTRELALQVTCELRKLSPAKGVNILAVYGGQDISQQIKKLKGATHVVIGTPGRLLDHIRRKTVDFSHVATLVLDEADQMLDMGFLKDIEQIIQKTPQKRQTMLFSATMPKEIRVLASQYMKEPVHIKVHSRNVTLDEIKQVVIETTDRNRPDALCKAIEEYNPFMAIIFCRTKRRVTALHNELQRKKYNSSELHGDLSQAKRESVMKRFRKAETQLLIATDVAARGLDIGGITHIFNYDIPQDIESYIHRIGRTGRAGQAGMAVTLVTPKDRGVLSAIEKGIETTIEKRRIERDEKVETGNIIRPASDNTHGGYARTKSGGRNQGKRYLDRGSTKRVNFSQKRGPGAAKQPT